MNNIKVDSSVQDENFIVETGRAYSPCLISALSMLTLFVMNQHMMKLRKLFTKKGLKSGIFPARGGGGVWVDLGIFLAVDTFRKMSSVLSICFAIYWSHFRQKWPFVQPTQ